MSQFTKGKWYAGMEDRDGPYVLTPKGWIPATPIEYEPPKPPLWAKPLIWLFDWYLKHRKETDKNETAENDV